MTYDDTIKLYNKPQITRKEAESLFGLHERKLGSIRQTVLQRSKFLPYNRNYIPVEETCHILDVDKTEQVEIIQILKAIQTKYKKD